MSIETVIIESSNEPIAALAPRAEKALEKPDHGVKIVTKGAYFVIRDCAKITTQYLPLYLYGKLKDPLKSLKGKFKMKDIMAFTAQDSVESKQLRTLMVLDALKVVSPKKNSTKRSEPIEDNDDVYGDYGSEQEVVTEPEQDFDFDNVEQVVDVLSRAFEAK